MRPIGVFGGMFDPIHFGHLRTAHELHELLGLEAIAFVPAGDPPHRAAPLADAETRLAMVRAAVGDDAAFFVDDRELRRSGPSYTILTLEALRSRARRAADRADHGHGRLRGHRAAGIARASCWRSPTS
jgi:nicotinate-nucleotide adenylyltransferase